MTDLLAPNIKVRSLKTNPIKVSGVTKYIKSKQEQMTVIGLKLGKRLHLLFQDMGGGIEFWTPENIIDLYISGHDNMASTIGMDFLNRNKLLTGKQKKEIETRRQAIVEEATDHIEESLTTAVNMLKEQDDPKSKRILDVIRSLVNEG